MRLLFTIVAMREPLTKLLPPTDHGNLIKLQVKTLPPSLLSQHTRLFVYIQQYNNIIYHIVSIFKILSYTSLRVSNTQSLAASTTDTQSSVT